MVQLTRLALAAGGAVVATAAIAQPAGQKVTGPVASYWMSAETRSGLGMPMSGAADPRAMMQGLMGGGAAQKSLLLQLGSSRKAAGEPSAEHLPPPALRAGASLPLVTPRARPAAPPEERTGPPPEMQKPRGRMLIFWGCGERAKPGQPLTIDFAKAAAGQVPPGIAALSRGLDLKPMQPPSPQRNATYGEWPNERTRTQVPPAGSLVGDHTVRGNYSPEIRFALAPDQDFLGPLDLVRNAKAPAGFGELGWRPVTGARAYLATAMGGDGETMVLWTSSETQASAFAIPDYISQGDIARLVASRGLMGPQTTACAIPKEALDAAPQLMFQLVAYGGEANFVHPPRPADPKVAWNQEWQVKVRYRSATGGMLGMQMPGAEDADDGEDAPADPRAQKPQDDKAKRRQRILKGLGETLRVPIP